MVIITRPRPILKKMVRVRPSAMRPAATAASRVAMAAGQGIIPPDIPRRRRFQMLYGSFAAVSP